MNCHVCGNPATCVGVYEDSDADPAPACDNCCGHGNEDGWCIPIEDWKAKPHLTLVDSPTVIRFPKTPRIPKAQHIWEDFPNHTAIVEEKIDGANVGIRFHQGELTLQSRGHILRGGRSERQFSPLYGWAHQRFDALRDALGERFVLYGEWCFAKHRAFYDNLPDWLFAIDVFDTQTEDFLATPTKDALLGPLKLATPPRLYQGPLKKAPAFMSLLGPTTLKTTKWKDNLISQARKVGHPDPLAETDDSDQMEGVYVRIEDGTHVVARIKAHRQAFQKTPSKGWRNQPLINNMLRKPA